jgi:hypothetical protein
MVAEFLDCVILISVVDDRSVVTREQDERIREQPVPFERRYDFADAGIELSDRVATRPHRCRSSEARMRYARNVNIVRGEEKEERRALVRVNE